MRRRLFLSHVVAAIAATLTPVITRAAEALQTGLVFDEIFLTRFFGPDHPEQPERLQVARKAITSAGLDSKLKQISLKQINDNELRLVHTAAHIAGIRFNHGPIIDKYARAGVGGTLAACDAVHRGLVRNCFVLVRP